MKRMKKTCIPVIIFFISLGTGTTTLWSQAVRADRVVNIGGPVNTPVDDFGPSFTADGKVMVFNSKRTGEPYQNIYMSSFENGSWSRPVPVSEINSPFNDETPYITPDAGYIFFASDRDGSFVLRGDRPGEVKISYDIYVSKNSGGRWEAPIRLPGSVNTEHHERSPSLSTGLTTLYYTTWAFGDITRTVIMKAEYSDGMFINPAPLPSPINMNTQDLSVMPAADGKGVYFSSRRPGGYGGWDLYFSGYENGRFAEPVNLGSAINSPANEVHASIFGDVIYFCSNREGGFGQYDIYAAPLPVTGNVLRFIVKDKKTGKPLSVELRLSTKVKKGEGETLTYELKKRTDEKGESTVHYNPQVSELDVVISEKGYLPLFKTIDVPGTVGLTHILELAPLEKEASFDIQAIYFDFESSRIRPESFPYLSALVAYLKANPALRFEIIGHTDLHGGDEFNNQLSRERAQAIKNHLVKQGIDSERLTTRGAGKTQPKVPRLGSPYDTQNRRTEFKLIGK